jgi:hypothetical protein
MKVKVFDEGHEKDLEASINDFLMTGINVVDIKFSVSTSVFSEEQVYCFSALIMYE